jgi:N6-adenosine-specific RNA methylase IME4
MNVRFEHTPSEPVVFHEYANLFPMLQGEALDALRADIRAHGVREPVVFLGGAILDGRNRYMCARDLGIEYPRVEFSGDDPLAFVISHNLHRRHLTESQRASIAARVANMGHGGNRKVAEQDANLRLDIPPSQQAMASAPVTVSDAARMMNVSERSVTSARKVHEQGAPELVQAVDEGRVKVSTAAEIARAPKEEQAEIVAKGEKEILAAAKAIRAEKAEARKAQVAEIKARPVERPLGTYDVIVLDPPWPMEKIERDVRPNQVAFDYPTMTEEEIAALALPAAPDCHVFVWTTHKFLPMALRLMDAWGARYVCTMVWHKPGGFQPIGLPQYNCEFALYGRIGSPKFIDTKAFPVCFNAPRGAHSEKPEEFYDVIRRVTDGQRLDMFNRRAIDGFDVWGNESVAVAS